MYLASIRKGLLIAVVVFLADVGGSALLAFIGFSLLGLIGDLLLIETGLLAVVGGFVEFSRSKGVYEFRRVLFHTKEEFSERRHKEASRGAIVLFSTSLALFSFLVVLILFE
jgi:hypothetical protein